MSNHKQIIEKIIKVGQQVEPAFFITPEQEQYYINLYLYFFKLGGIHDNTKGLIISGSVGTGKTLSMKVMQRLGAKMNIVSTRHIVREFMMDKGGVQVLDTYGRKSFALNGNGNVEYSKPVTYCFDDLLLEEVNAKFYGNQQNIMAEILLDRYDMFKRCHLLTFATSNADIATLEQNYGVRVRDRIREMCNYVTLTGNTFRK